MLSKSSNDEKAQQRANELVLQAIDKGGEHLRREIYIILYNYIIYNYIILYIVYTL